MALGRRLVGGVCLAVSVIDAVLPCCVALSFIGKPVVSWVAQSASADMLLVTTWVQQVR